MEDYSRIKARMNADCCVSAAPCPPPRDVSQFEAARRDLIQVHNKLERLSSQLAQRISGARVVLHGPRPEKAEVQAPPQSLEGLGLLQAIDVLDRLSTTLNEQVDELREFIP